MMVTRNSVSKHSNKTKITAENDRKMKLDLNITPLKNPNHHYFDDFFC